MISGIEGKAVYISAPMSSKPFFNKFAMEKAEEECWASGAIGVYNPARMINKGFDRPECMAVDIENLLELRRKADLVMVQLPDWQLSTGCLTEWMVAVACGIETKEVNIDA